MNSYKQKLALLLLLLETRHLRNKARRYRKRRNRENGDEEPRLKRTRDENSSSSSDDDDDESYDSDDSSEFDLFSSATSDSDDSTFEDYSNSDNESNGSDSEESRYQEDISIKDEPLFETDGDLESEDASTTSKKRAQRKNSSEVRPIKTEVLDRIVDAVEVDRNSLLNDVVQVKQEPVDSTVQSVVKEEMNVAESSTSSKQQKRKND